MTGMIQRWEYKTRMGNLNAVELNILGDEGWELVSIFNDPANGGVRFFFKRALP